MGHVRSWRRNVLVDGVLGATVTLVVGVAIAADLGGSRAPDAVAYLFAVSLGALMLVRRQYPVLVLITTAVGLLAYYSVGYPPIGLALPVSAALYSAAEAGHLRVTVGTAGGLLLVSVGFRLREGDDPAYLLGFDTTSTIGMMATAIALGIAIRATHLLRVEKRRAELRAALDREREARRRVEEERMRIARDLHDVLAHTVAVVSVQADVAAETLEEAPGRARAALSVIRSAGDEAIRELRSTVGLLRARDDTERHAPTGSLEHLDKLAQTSAESGLRVDVRVEGDRVQLPVVVDTTAYRIVQESLTNCLRHARATHAEVVLRYEPRHLGILVTDDGRGAAARNGTRDGRGILGMRERAALLGGWVEAGPRPDSGFRVEASLPTEVRW